MWLALTQRGQVRGRDLKKCRKACQNPNSARVAARARLALGLPRESAFRDLTVANERGPYADN